MRLENKKKPSPSYGAGNNGASRRRILILDDNETTCKHLQQLLQTDPELSIEYLTNAKQAFEWLSNKSFSILLTDLRMPGLDGMDLIKTIQEIRLPVTVIVTTGHGSIDQAVQPIRMGACDFLTKPVDIEQLRLVICRALRERELQDEVALLRAQLHKNFSFQNILSKNERMHAIFELINNVAHTDSTVLIEGETGTGKEQV